MRPLLDSTFPEQSLISVSLQTSTIHSAVRTHEILAGIVRTHLLKSVSDCRGTLRMPRPEAMRTGAFVWFSNGQP